MNLQKRIEQLEQRSGTKYGTPLCLFLVALRADDRDDTELVTSYTAGDRTWTRHEDETGKQLKERVAADVEATGRVTLVCAQYQKEAS